MRGLATAGVLGVLALCGCAEREATAQQPGADAPARTEFYSTAAARDGDDLEFSVRMHGIDAPERGKTCGAVNVWQSSRAALRVIVRDRRVDCVVVGHDEQDERMVAQCSVEGRDIGEQMVEAGWARDWPRYSHRRYAAAEARAREARRGIWGLNCPADLWGDRDYSPSSGAPSAE